MTKVAIIGNAGGGKSTIAKRLSRANNLPHHYIDLIQWQPHWERTPENEIKAKLNGILAEDRWLIDGWGPWETIENRFTQADTIIFVDLPLYIHYWWSTKRQLKTFFSPREDLPENCSTIGKMRQLYQMIAFVDQQLRPKIIDLLQTHKPDKEKVIYHIQSPSEINRFLEAHG